MRGNPDNLRQAAARKSAAAQARAEQGLREMIRRNEPITFRGLAQTAGVSLDFLYRCTADPPTRRTTAGPTAEHTATGSSDHDPGRQPEQRRPHPHRPARRTQTTSPRRGQHSAGRRSRPPTARTSNYDAALAKPPPGSEDLRTWSC